MNESAEARKSWPPLPLDAWEDTYRTLHMWTQVVGKVRLMKAPPLNHWWGIPLHLTARGLTTTPIPHGTRTFEIAFDFVDHRLDLATSAGNRERIPLEARSVSAFYREVMDALDRLGVPVRIRTTPVEVEEAIPFEENDRDRSYDPEAVRRFWHGLRQVDRVFKEFRARYLGKSSPVHFFWGSFDLAYTRFSGREAPEHPGGFPNMPDWATREAYSHEVWSGGFWPGLGLGEPAFFAYAYPEPDGFADADPGAEGAYYHGDLGEFVLPYEAVRSGDDPDGALLGFLESTYQAAAELGEWPRGALERSPGELERLRRRIALSREA